MNSSEMKRWAPLVGILLFVAALGLNMYRTPSPLTAVWLVVALGGAVAYWVKTQGDEKDDTDES